MQIFKNNGSGISLLPRLITLISFVILLLNSTGCTTTMLSQKISRQGYTELDKASLSIERVYKSHQNEFVVCTPSDKGFRIYRGQASIIIPASLFNETSQQPVAWIPLDEKREVEYCETAIFSPGTKKQWKIVSLITLSDHTKIDQIKAAPDHSPVELGLKQGLYRYIDSKDQKLLYVDNDKPFRGYHYLFIKLPDKVRPVSKSGTDSFSFYSLLYPFAIVIDAITFPFQFLLMCNAEC